MRVFKVYECVYCDTRYDDETECRACEMSHPPTGELTIVKTIGKNPITNYPQTIIIASTGCPWEDAVFEYKYATSEYRNPNGRAHRV